ncbi:hypothetical protein GCM10010442_15580 [Kitasatospora kifunensis]
MNELISAAVTGPFRLLSFMTGCAFRVDAARDGPARDGPARDCAARDGATGAATVLVGS